MPQHGLVASQRHQLVQEPTQSGDGDVALASARLLEADPRFDPGDYRVAGAVTGQRLKIIATDFMVPAARASG
jgi:hypothetical protein